MRVEFVQCDVCEKKHDAEYVSYFTVESGQTMRQLLQMTEDELIRYGNPPPSVEATVTDGDGNTYRGTLYLVKEDKH